MAPPVVQPPAASAAKMPESDGGARVAIASVAAMPPTTDVVNLEPSPVLMESTGTDSSLPAQTEDPLAPTDKATDDVATAAGGVTTTESPGGIAPEDRLSSGFTTEDAATAAATESPEGSIAPGDRLSSGFTADDAAAAAVTKKLTTGTSASTERSLVQFTPPAVGEAETRRLSGPTPIPQFPLLSYCTRDSEFANATSLLAELANALKKSAGVSFLSRFSFLPLL